MQINKILLSVLSVASIFGLSACSSSEPDTQPQAELASSSINEQPTYTVNVTGENPPYTLSDEKGNKIGLEADLLNAIAKKQGFKVNIVSHPWGGIFDSLATDKADLVCSGLFITPERAAKYQITRPYMSVKLGSLVAADSDINTSNDLIGKIVMGRTGSNVFEDILKNDLLKGQATNTQGYPTTYLAVQALAQQKGDAVFAVETTLKDIQKNLQKSVKTKYIPYDGHEPIYVGCFAKKGRNDDLIKKFDAGLQQLADDGSLAKIMIEWTGQADTLPNVDTETLYK